MAGPLAAFASKLGSANAGMQAVSGSAGSAGGMYPPLSRFLEQIANKTWPNENPSIADLIELRHKGEIGVSDFGTICEERGIDTALGEKLYKASAPLLSALDYISLERRGLLPEGSEKALGKLGYTPETVSLLKKATEYFPTPPDIIQFAVREVYSRGGTTAEFGQFSAPPPEYIKAAVQAGLSEDFAEKYWFSHWKLPSPEQLFRMLHYEQLNAKQVADMLQANDLMPGFVEKMMAISYHPLTRVDIRRIRKAGKIDKARVAKEYERGGYNKADAALLAEWIEDDLGEDVAGVTRGMVMEAYENGLNDENETRSLLEKVGLSPDAQNLLFELSDYKIKKASLDVVTAELGAQFELGLIQEGDIRDRLQSMEAPKVYIDRAMARIIGKESAKTKLPSRSDLERWFEKDLIGENEYYTGMIALGYSRANSQMYLAEILKDRDEPERKYLTVAIYQRWVKGGIMNEAEFSTVMRAQGTTQSDIDKLIQEAHTSGKK